MSEVCLTSCLTCTPIYSIVVADTRDEDWEELTDELDQRDAPTMWPMLAAIAVVVILLGVVFIYQWTRPFSDRVGPDDEVRIAINNHYTAQNALNYQSFSEWTCAAKTPPREEFLKKNGPSRDANGKIVIHDGGIADVAINGDKASAVVTWRYEKKPDQPTTTPTTLVRQGDQWKVC